MKKLFVIITVIATLLFTNNANAQGGWTALTGSDKVARLTPETGNFDKIKISLRNNSPLPRKYTIITYQPSDNGSNGTQGFVLMPTFSKKFQLEVGTRLYIADSDQIDTVMGGQKLTGKPFLTVKAEDSGKIFGLNK